MVTQQASWLHLVRPIGKKSSRSRGATLVEFALVATLFFFLILVVLDFCWLFYAQANLQDAVRLAARYASTGNHQTTSDGSTVSRIASIAQIVENNTHGAQIQNITIASNYSGSATISSGGVLTKTSSASAAGGPNDIGTVSVSAQIPFMTTLLGNFFGGSQFQITAKSSYRNEPFDFSQIQ